MFSLRNRFGIPGVISVIALVFAMLGGAYAASNSGGGKATASKTGKRGPRGLRGLAGPTGPQGLPGANGKDGAPGAPGKDGTDGTAGADGKSVITTPIAEGGAQCEGYGGTEVEVEGSGSPEEVCDGEEGPQGVQGNPWTAGGTLPKGATETGLWAFGGQFVTFKDGEAKTVTIGHLIPVPISFPIPLAAIPGSSKFIYTKKTQSTCEAKSEPEKATCLAELAAHCPGTAVNPTAAEGYACIYELSLGATAKFSSGGFNSVAGGKLNFLPIAEGELQGYGTWAVTGS